MRILFAGTPAMGVPALEALAREFEVRGVLTNPDAPAGRRSTPRPSPVKTAALGLGLTVLQPSRLDLTAVREVAAVGAELLVVVAFGRIFGPTMLSLFPRGGLNLHPSLLPRYRGPAPIPAAIAAGDRITGITVQRVAREVDGGNILAQCELPIGPRDTTATLTDRVAVLGARMLVDVVRSIEAGTAVEVEQDDSKATWCRLLGREDGRVDWGESAEVIERKIRAYTPFPGVFTTWGGRLLRLHEAAVHPEPEEVRPRGGGEHEAPRGEQGRDAPRRGGVVLGCDSRYGILVSTGRGILCVSKLQLESKKMLDWRSFLNGNRELEGSRLGVDS